MAAPTYKLKLRIPRKIGREQLSQWIWDRFLPEGLLGVHEGTLLSAEAAEKGLETESWTVDAALAPRERDWIAAREQMDDWVDWELFFETRGAAENAARLLSSQTDIGIHAIEEQPDQDWDAQWKAAFLGSETGIPAPSGWRVLPPWVDPARALQPGERALRINPGAGFGTGTHETTQLCLGAIGETALGAGSRVLDFGSGSGILAIGAALLGASVDAVEIDPLAVENAVGNARINGVQDRIRYLSALPSGEIGYRLVVANILKPVLLEFAGELASRAAARGALVLSGLIEPDVEGVAARYRALLGGREPEIRCLGEWRALIWRR